MSCRRHPIALFTTICVIVISAHVHESTADTLPPIVLGKDDRVCWRIYGSVNAVQDCLVRANSAIQELLDNRMTWISKILEDNDLSTSVLNDSDKIWEENRKITCDKLIWERDKEGSRRRTEPLRCHYFMTKYRYDIIDAIYLFSTRIKVSEVNIDISYRVCWNPYGWKHELDCLKNIRKEAIKSLDYTLKKIFGDEYMSSKREADQILRESQSAWREEVDVTCKNLASALQKIRSDALEKEVSVWCEFLMARIRERLFLTLYEFRLHQKGVEVRQ